MRRRAFVTVAAAAASTTAPRPAAGADESPIGFALGLAAVYALSVRWVFRHRRLADARVEFLVFTSIGLAGMALNQLVIYAGVEHLSLSYEMAKMVSAAVVFCFNFGLRKLLLFTRD